jgi:MarR-like DNA-binding transcriptional regulator SgrR of sgrS sRNA
MRSLVLVNSIFLLWGISCTRQHSPLSTTKPKREFRWLTNTLPELDAKNCASSQCLSHFALFSEGLTRLKLIEGALQVTPALAKAWKQEAPNRIRFEIKEGILWSDGEKLTSDHFMNAWKRNAGSVRTQIKKISEKEILVQSPPGTFLSPAFFSKVATFPLRDPRDKKGQPPVLGAYLFPQRERDHWVYSRNPAYHGNKPENLTIDVRVVSSARRRLDLVEEASADFAEAPPALGSPTQSQKVTFPTNEGYYLFFSPALFGRRTHSAAPLRKVLQKALQPDEFVKAAGNEGLPLLRLFPLLAAPSDWKLTFQAEKAQSDFAVELKTFPQLTHSKTILSYDDAPKSSELALNVQAQWLKTLNFRVDVAAKNPKVPSQLSVAKWTWDPTSVGWGLEKIAVGLSPVSQPVMETERQLVNEEVLAVPLLHEVRSAVANKTLTGVTISPDGAWDFTAAHF